MPYKDPEKRKQHCREYNKKNKDKIWARRKNDPDYRTYMKSYMKDYNKKNDKNPRKRFTTTRWQSKKRGLEFSISFEQFKIEIEKPCVYCNNLLGKRSVCASGLDRMDNSKGYIIDNICSCCWICNSIKGEHLSFEEMKEVVKLIIKMRDLQ
jgi:hypothetical protein